MRYCVTEQKMKIEQNGVQRPIKKYTVRLKLCFFFCLAAITRCHKLRSLNQQMSIILQFWKIEVHV